MPKGEEEEQEMENVTNNEGKLPNLAKELDMQVQDAQRVPCTNQALDEVGSKKKHTETYHN